MGREARVEAAAEVGSGVNLNLPPTRDPVGREGAWGSGSPQCEWSLDSVKENVLWDPNFLWLSARGGEDGRVCSVPAPAVTSCPSLLGASAVLAPKIPISGLLIPGTLE